LLPTPTALHTDGLDAGTDMLAELLRVDIAAWRDEVPSIEEHYAAFGDRLPSELVDQLDALAKRLAG